MLVHIHVCTHTHMHTHTEAVIGIWVLPTVGVVSGGDTSLTHLSLTWRSRQHFVSGSRSLSHKHTHTKWLPLQAIKVKGHSIPVFPWIFTWFPHNPPPLWRLFPTKAECHCLSSSDLLRGGLFHSSGGTRGGCDILTTSRVGSRYCTVLKSREAALHACGKSVTAPTLNLRCFTYTSINTHAVIEDSREVWLKFFSVKSTRLIRIFPQTHD